MPVLRVVRFTPQGVGVDTRLRDDLVPDLLRIPGIRGVFAGRMGPGDDGRRLLATVWTSIDAIAPGARGSGGTTGADPEHLADAPGREAETYPLAIAIAPLGPADIGILRLVRGRTRAGALDEYVRQAREGTITDRVLGVGPERSTSAPTGPAASQRCRCGTSGRTSRLRPGRTRPAPTERATPNC